MSRVKTAVRKTKILLRGLDRLARDKPSFRSNMSRLRKAWRTAGTEGLKGALLALANEFGPHTWTQYRARFAKVVRPRIMEKLRKEGAPHTISVIVPTFNTPAEMLKDMLDSVLAQLYPNWELCVADDGSTQGHVREILDAYAAKDARIKVHLGDGNKGVSHASNRALDMASGSFVVLLDHDDFLEEQALYRVAEAMQHDDPDMVYSDEMAVSSDATEILHYVHRPAFSPEYLRSHPYIVHMVGFRTSLLREIGGWDEALRISQDYDLILRFTEKSRTIVHLPEVLYRWRIHPSSAGHQKMNEVMEVSTAALQRHLDRCGLDGVMGSGVDFNFFEGRYPIDPSVRVAIIIPTKNLGQVTRQCIDSIYRTVVDVRFDIILIDHQSDDPASITYFNSLGERARVLNYEGPFNFSAINNWAVARLDRPYSHYLFCNNDIEAMGDGWLGRMVEACRQDSVGIVGAQLLYGDRLTIQHAGVCIGAYGAAEHYAKFVRPPTEHPGHLYIGRLVATHEVAAVTAACLLMRRETFEEIDGFDETLAVGFGDVDLCLRALDGGWRVLYCPGATLVHHESVTRGQSHGKDPHPEDSAKFQARWGKLLSLGDPYFNPGLSLMHTDFRVRSPLPCELTIQRRVFERDPQSGRQRLRHT